MDHGTQQSAASVFLGWEGILSAAFSAPYTLIISLAAILAAVSPIATSVLELARLPLAHGELWRLITGHVTHFGANHLLWDLAMFAALGYVCEVRWPHRTRATLLMAGFGISLAVVCLAPEFDVYRGLSGLDSALFGLLATSLLGDEKARPGHLLRTTLWLLLAGFAAKVGYEMVAATTFFVDSKAAGFIPVPLAHAVGFVAGAAMACLPARRPIGTPRAVSYDG
jgi:rhomboid family GlyGly-CTERM serine protease